MKLKQVLTDIPNSMTADLGSLEISGISYNTAKVEKGDIFVCIKGYKADGHDFAGAAIEKGAIAILAEKQLEDIGVPVIITKDTRAALSKMSVNFFGNPSGSMDIFGITGTNGKTSITYMLRKILKEAGKNCGIIGTIAYEYNDVKEPAANTTPESYEIQRIFYQMREAGVSACAMEASSHALSMDRVLDVSFDFGIFTNLTPDHLDFHSTLEEYYLAKKKLFYMTRKTGIINTDDSYGKRLYTELKEEGRSCESYSLKDKNADWFADVTAMDETGSAFTLFVYGEEKGEIKICIPGVFSIYNIVAAVGAAMISGVTFEEARQGAGTLKGVPGRFETVENDKGIIAIVDYAHTPDALENVLETVNSFKKGRLICVFGCGGDRDKTKRPLMGKAAGSHADYCIVTSDNPRTEMPKEIIAEIEPGIYETGCNYEIIENRLDAIGKAVSMYQKNDIILVAGKGHEDYQIIGTEKIHFDDKEALKTFIDESQR